MNSATATIQRKFVKNCKANGLDADSPFDDIFAMLLDFLKQFLAGGACLGGDVKDVTNNHELFVYRKLISKSMDEGYSRKDARAIAQSSIDTINSTSGPALAAMAE